MTSGYSPAGAWGVGLATLTPDSQILDVWFPQGRLGLGEPPWTGGNRDSNGTGRLTDDDATEAFGLDLTSSLGRDAVRGVEVVAVSVVIASLAAPPADAADAYLRLHLLSHRLVAPHGTNVDGIFGVLTTVAWTDRGPVAADRIEEVRLVARAAGHRLTVYGVDKFPRMVDYVVPSGVRVADADRVRLGAHLAAGTTVMHEGFVNYNAGTLGSSMVEGRISAGVVVGNGSDVGGGSSIMGTLSGGGKETVRVGERCLIGANAGCGISLGDDCVIEAGCYVTAGSKVTLPDGTTVKARELSGQPGLLFWRNSVTGTLEVKPRQGKADWGGLNAALHANA